MGSRDSTDEELITRAREGDRAAQHQLWRFHRRWVAAIVLAHRPRSIELDDLLQDVALKFIGKIHTLRESRAFRPWLRQITLNVCRGAGRSIKSTLRLVSDDRRDATHREPGSIAAPVPATGGVHQQLERREAAERLLQQALTLPIAYREPLLLRCVRSMSYKQISDVLGLPLTTIETRLARARRMLRQEISAAADRPRVESAGDPAEPR